MVATQRTACVFGIAKKSGVNKKLSLCVLRKELQKVEKKRMLIETEWWDVVYPHDATVVVTTADPYRLDIRMLMFSRANNTQQLARHLYPNYLP